MTDFDVMKFRIQQRILNDHEGSTVLDVDKKKCVVSTFVCMECKNKCDRVKEILKDVC